MALKRVLPALLVGSALGVPTLAWTEYFSQPLQEDAGFEINMDTSAAGEAALTITYLNRKGTRVRTMEIIMVPPGQRVSYVVGRIPKKSTSRIAIDVEPAGNNTVGIEVKQGATSVTRTCVGDCRITLGVVPAP